MFNSWNQDKPFLKKIKTHKNHSVRPAFQEAANKLQKTRPNCAWKETMTTLVSSPQLYEKLPEKAEGRKFIGSSSKLLSLENAVLSLICTSKHAWCTPMDGEQTAAETQDHKTRILQRQQKCNLYNEAFKKSWYSRCDWFTK